MDNITSAFRELLYGYFSVVNWFLLSTCFAFQYRVSSAWTGRPPNAKYSYQNFVILCFIYILKFCFIFLCCLPFTFLLCVLHFDSAAWLIDKNHITQLIKYTVSQKNAARFIFVIFILDIILSLLIFLAKHTSMEFVTCSDFLVVKNWQFLWVDDRLKRTMWQITVLDTVELQGRTTPHFRSGHLANEQSIFYAVLDDAHLKRAWLLHGLVCSSMSSTKPSIRGVDDCCAPMSELIMGDALKLWTVLFTYYSQRYLTVIWCDFDWTFIWRVGDLFDAALSKSLLVFTRYSTNIQWVCICIKLRGRRLPTLTYAAGQWTLLIELIPLK